MSVWLPIQLLVYFQPSYFGITTIGSASRNDVGRIGFILGTIVFICSSVVVVIRRARRRKK